MDMKDDRILNGLVRNEVEGPRLSVNMVFIVIFVVFVVSVLARYVLTLRFIRSNVLKNFLFCSYVFPSSTPFIFCYRFGSLISLRFFRVKKTDIFIHWLIL